ncbi:hypothetical protein PG990_013933 [Apiospora arundinis]
MPHASSFPFFDFFPDLGFSLSWVGHLKMDFIWKSLLEHVVWRSLRSSPAGSRSATYICQLSSDDDMRPGHSVMHDAAKSPAAYFFDSNGLNRRKKFAGCLESSLRCDIVHKEDCRGSSDLNQTWVRILRRFWTNTHPPIDLAVSAFPTLRAFLPLWHFVDSPRSPSHAIATLVRPIAVYLGLYHHLPERLQQSSANPPRMQPVVTLIESLRSIDLRRHASPSTPPTPYANHHRRHRHLNHTAARHRGEEHGFVSGHLHLVPPRN